MPYSPAHRTSRGYTLIELVVALGIFAILMTIAGTSFNTILVQKSKITKSEEMNIQGVVGLEMLRHDLAQAGFGLPTSFLFPAAPPQYAEAAAVAGSPASTFNDVDSGTGTGRVPRAIVLGDNLSTGVLSGTDYLAVKAATVGTSRASQLWTYENYSTGGKPPKMWASNNFNQNDNVVVFRRTFGSTGTSGNQLVYDSAAPQNFYAKYPNPVGTFPTNAFSATYQPVNQQETFYVYGVEDAAVNAPRMPFNRVDFFVSPTAASFCAPNTGTLTKGVVRHTDGRLLNAPLLDCVADMQVVLGWDFTGTGNVATVSDASGSTVISSENTAVATVQAALADPATIRNSLKVVKVYVLAQQGRKDTSYTNPSSTIVVGNDGESTLSKNFDLTGLGTDWMRYRWKVYRIIVNPKNLLSTN